MKFTNPNTQRLCAQWNFGAAARAINLRDAFTLPPAVLEVARILGHWVESRGARQLLSLTGDVAEVEPPHTPVIRAQTTVFNSFASALETPRFLVVFDTGPTASQSPPIVSASKLVHLRDLTPRKREVALLVCEGLTNTEVVLRLSKSVLTIKTELNAVFQKLGVESRGRLMALLHGNRFSPIRSAAAFSGPAPGTADKEAGPVEFHLRATKNPPG